MASGNEAGELLHALQRGRWQRLTDSLLPLLLWEDPGAVWWPVVRFHCALELLGAAGHGRAWGLTTETRLAWLRDLADTRALYPAELAALTVLEQWPER